MPPIYLKQNELQKSPYKILSYNTIDFLETLYAHRRFSICLKYSREHRSKSIPGMKWVESKQWSSINVNQCLQRCPRRRPGVDTGPLLWDINLSPAGGGPRWATGPIRCLSMVPVSRLGLAHFSAQRQKQTWP